MDLRRNRSVALESWTRSKRMRLMATRSPSSKSSASDLARPASRGEIRNRAARGVQAERTNPARRDPAFAQRAVEVRGRMALDSRYSSHLNVSAGPRIETLDSRFQIGRHCTGSERSRKWVWAFQHDHPSTAFRSALHGPNLIRRERRVGGERSGHRRSCSSFSRHEARARISNPANVP